jgi:zinc transporter ZupT
MISEDDVKSVDVPEWKKKALESKADPQAAPFGMEWKTEGTISATQAYDKIGDEHARNDPESPNKDLVKHTCTTPERKPKPINLTLALSILIGDGFHNFCDGIFIGVAFKLCGAATAWTIVFITLYHEIAQEVADFFLLTNHAGLTVTKALAVNFIAGLSVVIGGIVVVAADVSGLAIGVILAIASGVYLYIAATECLPRVNSVVSTNKDRLVTVLAFIAGAVPISLALLNHQHCEAAHSDEH